MYVKSALCQESGVCTSFVLLDVVAVKESVFTDVMLCRVRFAENRVVLLAFKFIFDAVLSNVLFHNHIPFVLQNSL